MVLNIRNREADELARRLAEIDRSSITEAVVTALKETLSTRRKRRTSAEIAREVLDRHGIALTEAMRRPVDPAVWDELHEDPTERSQ